jgi:hypothetical protein
MGIMPDVNELAVEINGHTFIPAVFEERDEPYYIVSYIIQRSWTHGIPLSEILNIIGWTDRESTPPSAYSPTGRWCRSEVEIYRPSRSILVIQRTIFRDV